MHACMLGPEDALERLGRMASVASRLDRLPRLEARTIRAVIGEMVKLLSTVSSAADALGLPRGFAEVAARCGRLLNEVSRALSVVEALQAAGAPGPHGEALRRLAALVAHDPCIEELKKLAMSDTAQAAQAKHR